MNAYVQWEKFSSSASRARAIWNHSAVEQRTSEQRKYQSELIPQNPNALYKVYKFWVYAIIATGQRILHYFTTIFSITVVEKINDGNPYHEIILPFISDLSALMGTFIFWITFLFNWHRLIQIQQTSYGFIRFCCQSDIG